MQIDAALSVFKISKILDDVALVWAPVDVIILLDVIHN